MKLPVALQLAVATTNGSKLNPDIDSANPHTKEAKIKIVPVISEERATEEQVSSIVAPNPRLKRHPLRRHSLRRAKVTIKKPNDSQ